MKVGDLVKLLDAKVLTPELASSGEVLYAFTSDLMSDVLTKDYDQAILVTGLSNLQAIRTAEMSDIKEVIIGRDKKVGQDMIDLARENGIMLLRCRYSLFRISGLLYEAGIKPVF